MTETGHVFGGGTDRRYLFGAVALAVAVLFAGAALSGAVAAQDDQPGDPVNFFGDAEDEMGNEVPAGVTIYAVVDGEVEDSITVEEDGSFGGADAFDDKLAVNDGAGDEVTFQLGNGATAAESLSLDDSDEVVEVSLTFPGGSFLQVDVTGDGAFATDTTGDGLLNDVDGDGEFTIFDVQAFFNNFNEPVVQDNAPAFNYQQNEGITIFDVQALFNQLATAG